VSVTIAEYVSAAVSADPASTPTLTASTDGIADIAENNPITFSISLAPTSDANENDTMW
jgi:hypothetical protein